MRIQKTSDKLKLIFLSLYFIILTIERILSLISIFTGIFSSYDVLDAYMTALTVSSIIGAYLYILVNCRRKCIPLPDDANTRPSNVEDYSYVRYLFGQLSVAAGLLLLSGMVHTEGTIPPIQFTAYGMLLISMAIHTAQSVKAEGNGVRKWISYAFIVAFSMAIPVVYHAELESACLFYITESIVSAGLVILFTIILRNHYLGDGTYRFPVIPYLLTIIGDIAVLALRWADTVNWFVLIFLSVSAVLWIIGKIISSTKLKK